MAMAEESRRGPTELETAFRSSSGATYLRLQDSGGLPSDLFIFIPFQALDLVSLHLYAQQRG